MATVDDNIYAITVISPFTMATLIGSSGAGDDLIRKLHDMGVSRSCTTIKQVMERRDAINQVIALERERQERLLEREMRTLKSGMRTHMLLSRLCTHERSDHGRALREYPCARDLRLFVLDLATPHPRREYPERA
jgi:hypothetical protein